MKRPRVFFRPTARSDMKDIYRYILQLSQDRRAASSYTDRIFARCLAIAEAPSGGADRSRWAPGLRMVPFERSVLILYIAEGDRIQIVRVVHGRRDVDGLMHTQGTP